MGAHENNVKVISESIKYDARDLDHKINLRTHSEMYADNCTAWLWKA